MKHFALTILLVILACGAQIQAQTVDSATCGTMKIQDQCQITWSFSRRAESSYSVQQFDPLDAEWRNVSTSPISATNEGRLETPVEAGYLYRVLACDDEDAQTNCSGSTMVWAPFVQPPSHVHLIPSRVPFVKWTASAGKPMYVSVSKQLDWLDQVIQYNVYLMVNAIARADISKMPDMTTVKDVRLEEPGDPIELVQYNVYWAYSAEQGNPSVSPEGAPFERPPHVHPERHPQ